MVIIPAVRFAAMEAAITKLQKRSVQVEARLNPHHEHYISVHAMPTLAMQETTQARVVYIEDFVQKMDTKLQAIEKILPLHVSRVNELEKTITKVQAQNNKITDSRLEGLEQSIKKLFTATDKLQTRVDKHVGHLKKFNADRTELQIDVCQAMGDCATMKMGLEGIKQNLDNTKQALAIMGDMIVGHVTGTDCPDPREPEPCPRTPTHRVEMSSAATAYKIEQLEAAVWRLEAMVTHPDFRAPAVSEQIEAHPRASTPSTSSEHEVFGSSPPTLMQKAETEKKGDSEEDVTALEEVDAGSKKDKKLKGKKRGRKGKKGSDKKRGGRQTKAEKDDDETEVEGEMEGGGGAEGGYPALNLAAAVERIHL